MRISFDLDDTLICYQAGVPQENRPGFWWRLLAPGEPLRLGARELLRRLRDDGWEIWVYTTSHRDPFSVYLWLRAYGIAVGRVINQSRHEQHTRRQGFRYPPSKLPSLWGIHLHVDDSVGVEEEGKQHGFRVVVVQPDDLAWTRHVLAAAEQIRQGYLR